MRRFLTGSMTILAVVLLVVGCGSSDDTAIDEPTIDEPTTTAAPATTTAPPTSAATTTTVSIDSRIATVEALQEALNAYDSDAVLALVADGGSWKGS